MGPTASRRSHRRGRAAIIIRGFMAPLALASRAREKERNALPQSRHGFSYVTVRPNSLPLLRSIAASAIKATSQGDERPMSDYTRH